MFINIAEIHWVQDSSNIILVVDVEERTQAEVQRLE